LLIVVYSVVKLATEECTKRAVAAKVVDFGSSELDIFRQEVECLTRIGVQSNIVQFYDYEICSDRGVIILELLPPKTLADFLDENGPLSTTIVSISIFSKLLKAVKTVHSKYIAHNDLKPGTISDPFLLHYSYCLSWFLSYLLENIAYDPINGTLKLFDFGLATIVNPNDPLIAFHGGSPLYMAPEILHDKHNPFLSDIWSLGIILYELLEGSAPLAFCSTVTELVAYLSLGSSSITYPEHFPESVLSLLRSIFRNDPTERISIANIQLFISKLLEDL
jgi:serine/threonine protein kinase